MTARGAQERELVRATRLDETIRRALRALLRTRERAQLCAAVCAALVEDGVLTAAWIGWRDAATGEATPVAHAGLADVPAETTTAGWRAALRARGMPASATVALHEGGVAQGSLDVHAPGGLAPAEVALLTELAEDVSYTLDALARAAERARARAAAEDERRFSEAMIESMPGIVYFYDEAERFLRWNHNFEQVSGYSADEIARMRPLEFFADEERALVGARIADVFAHGEARVEAHFVAKDGSRTLYDFTGRRVAWGGGSCLVGMGIDITARRRAELALRDVNASLERRVHERTAALAETTRFLDAIIDHLPDPVFYKDAELRFLGANRAYERAFGVSRDAMIGKTVLDLGYLPDEDRRRYQDDQRALLATGVTIRREATMPFADHRQHQTLYSVTGITRDDGSSAGVVGSIVDITALKDGEAALARAMHAAEAADRLKSAFLATMSHELRTPLNSIIGFTGILLQGLAGPLNEEQSKQLGMVRGSARHLLDLINDVLDISKIEAGQMTVRQEPVDLRGVLDKVLGVVRPLAERKALALRLDAPPTLPPLTSDARRIEQILLNLLNNAVKFTERGGVTLAVELAAPDLLRLRVVDTGEGIAAADLPRLFLPFTQIDTGLTRRYEGTGLGLAICKRLTLLLGGDIACTSAPGEGSTFTVDLPLRPRPA